MHCRLRSSTLLVTLALGGVAAAEPAPDLEAARLEAQRLFRRGNAEREAGDLEEALTLFAAANRVFPHALYLLETGRVNQELGRLQLARATYLRVLAIDAPIDSLKERARRYLDEVEAELARRTAAQTPRPAPAVPPARASSPPPQWPAWALGGAGGALVVTSAVLGWKAHDDLATLDAALAERDDRDRVTGISEPDAIALERRANREAIGAAVTGGIGAIAIAGAVWWRHRSRSRALEVVIAPDRVVLGGRF